MEEWEHLTALGARTFCLISQYHVSYHHKRKREAVQRQKAIAASVESASPFLSQPSHYTHQKQQSRKWLDGEKRLIIIILIIIYCSQLHTKYFRCIHQKSVSTKQEHPNKPAQHSVQDKHLKGTAGIKMEEHTSMRTCTSSNEVSGISEMLGCCNQQDNAV